MKMLVRDFIMERIIKNLLQTQHVAAERGDYTGSIRTAKLLIKLAKKYGNNVVDFSSVKGNEEYSHPPDDGH